MEGEGFEGWMEGGGGGVLGFDGGWRRWGKRVFDGERASRMSEHC